MSSPTVSVIITTYNRASLLCRAIESVLAQTFQDFELIISDDSSTDETEQIVKEFQKNEKRIKYIRTESNSGGAAVPKNMALQEAKGKYIATLDSDDKWLSKKLEIQVQAFLESKNPKLGFISCDYFLMVDKDKVRVSIPVHADVLLNILGSDYMGTGSCLIYKREVFDTVGGFDEKMKSSQDWEMRIRLAQHYDFLIVHEPLVEYFVHGENISIHTPVEGRRRAIDYIVSKHKKLYEAYPKAAALQKRYTGTWLAMTTSSRQATKEFLASIRKNPFAPMTYFLLFVSLFGRRLYILANRVKNYF